MQNSIIYINMNADDTTFKSALQGYYYFYVNNGICVNMSKSILIITSKIFEKDTDVKIELPSHNPFYLTVKSINGCENILIEKNKPLELTIKEGESIEAILYKSQSNNS